MGLVQRKLGKKLRRACFHCNDVRRGQARQSLSGLASPVPNRSSDFDLTDYRRILHVVWSASRNTSAKTKL
jgi:hypothetical protein